jgi:hypothetical protein
MSVIPGHAVALLLEALHNEWGRSRVRFLIVSLEFFLDIILPEGRKDKRGGRSDKKTRKKM